MNFFVIPREIQEINKRGKITCGGVSKNHEKNIRPPVYFEPESNQCIYYRNKKKLYTEVLLKKIGFSFFLKVGTEELFLIEGGMVFHRTGEATE